MSRFLSAKPVLRGILIAAGLVYALLAWGHAARTDWAVALWPWPDTPLSHSFIGSVYGALATGALWVGLAGPPRAAIGSLRGIAVIYGTVGVYLAGRSLSGAGAHGLSALLALATAGLALGLLLALRRLPQEPVGARPLELAVRASCVVFALVLALAGAAMVARLPGVFPWPLSPQSSTVFGLVFLGLSLVYADVAVTGSRPAATIAMTGFLVYDLILLPPFLSHFGRVAPDLMLSLTVYTGVLIYSAGLAVWFIARALRSG